MSRPAIESRERACAYNFVLDFCGLPLRLILLRGQPAIFLNELVVDVLVVLNLAGQLLDLQ